MKARVQTGFKESVNDINDWLAWYSQFKYLSNPSLQPACVKYSWVTKNDYTFTYMYGGANAINCGTDCKRLLPWFDGNHPFDEKFTCGESFVYAARRSVLIDWQTKIKASANTDLECFTNDNIVAAIAKSMEDKDLNHNIKFMTPLEMATEVISRVISSFASDSAKKTKAEALSDVAKSNVLKLVSAESFLFEEIPLPTKYEFVVHQLPMDQDIHRIAQKDPDYAWIYEYLSQVQVGCCFHPSGFFRKKK